jgi:hypothetical protein
MKKWLLLIGLSLGCFAALAQPTSLGGITPGQTTREELKSLVNNPGRDGAKDYAYALALKQLDGLSVSVKLHNDIVYEVSVSVDFSPGVALRQALIEKYGQPGIKVGDIRTVTCQNKLGASFQRLEGKEELRWPVKDGVQGAFETRAEECDAYVSREYVLRHVATAKAVELAAFERRRKEAEEQKRKLGGAY